jgi:iron complex outermembrane receptor protein
LKKALFSAILLVCSLMAASQDCQFILKGHIEDLDSKEKLAGASVLLVELNKEIITDAQGDFIFNALCEGNYTVRVTHVGCATTEQRVLLNRSRHLDIDLPHEKNMLGEITLNSQRGLKSTGLKKELSSRDMEESKGQSLAEALSKMNGVTMLQTGSTVSKPVIHGLHSNRILTINNGVRQEGQQWGSEHAPEIDPFIANKLIVIKGVDELKYGSDAIGGVILVEPKALMTTAGYTAEVNSAYFTNNRQYVLSGSYEQQLKQLPAFTFRVQGTFKKGANARTPGYRLNNTGSDEKNFSLTGGWKGHHFSSELFYSFFDTKLGIFEGAHIGNLTDLQAAIGSSRPAAVFTGESTYRIDRPYQAVNHHLLKSRSSLQLGNNRFNLLLAAQMNDRKEFDIVRNSSNQQPQLDLRIITLSEELGWEQIKVKALSHMAGISSMQQENQYAGRYFIPAYRSNNFGGYYISKWNSSHWELQAGLRFDHKTIYTNRINANGQEFDNYDFRYNTLGASLNGGYKTGGWKTNANIALANRAPQVNELLSNGIHHGAATYEVGNIHLNPERSINLSLNNAWSNKDNTIGFEVNFFRNSINDFIYQQPKPDEPVLTIAGAFPQLVYQQNDALLQGVDFSSRILFIKPFSWELKYSLLRARNKDKDDWLIRMPADRLQNEFTWNFPDGKKLTASYISVEGIYVQKQTRVPGEKDGRQDYKEAPGAYTLLNADLGTTFLVQKIPVTFSIGIRNMFNTSYRDYLNSLRYFTDETGRNIQLRLKIPFKNIGA